MRSPLLLRPAKPLAGVLLALVLVVLSGGAAGAHAVLEASDPPSGARLDAAPTVVRLDFDEPVGIDLGYVRLSHDGRSIAIGAPQHPAGHPDVVVADLPKLAPGLYVVGYRVVSEDGHPVSGDIAFRIGAGSVAVKATSSGDQSDRGIGLAYGLVRLVAYVGLVIAIGVPIVIARVQPSWWPRARVAVGSAAAALTVAAFAQVALAGAYLAGTSWGDVVDADRWGDVVGSTAGRWWVARAVVAAAFAVLVLVGTRRPDRPRPTVLATLWLAGGLVVWSFVADGHAVAGRWVAAGEVATFVHLVAMACWLGGLGVLVAGAAGIDGDGAEEVARRWSPLAAVCVGAVALSGIAQAWRVVGGWDLGSTYQRLLVAKTLGVVAMLGLAVVARRLLARVGEGDAAPRRLRRGVAVELAVGITVLVVTTVLVQTSPSDGAASSAAAGASTSGSQTPVTTAPPTSWSTTVEQGGRKLQLHVDGATVGRHSLHVVLDDSAEPLGEPVTARARLLLQEPALGPFPVLLEASGDRSWVADGLEITRPGAWRLEVIIDDPSSSIRFSTDLPVDG